MTTFTIGRWLLVALAIVGLALAVPAVSAHGNGSAADAAHPYNATPDEWAAWMTGHMGPGAVEWMESHMGVTVDEMAQDMGDDDYHGGMYGQGHYDGGMYGQGHC